MPKTNNDLNHNYQTIEQAAWVNHSKHNNQFLKGTSRTCRDAFGVSWDEDKLDNKDKWDLVVFVVVVLFGGLVLVFNF